MERKKKKKGEVKEVLLIEGFGHILHDLYILILVSPDRKSESASHFLGFIIR